MNNRTRTRRDPGGKTHARPRDLAPSITGDAGNGEGSPPLNTSVATSRRENHNGRGRSPLLSLINRQVAIRSLSGLPALSALQVRATFLQDLLATQLYGASWECLGADIAFELVCLLANQSGHQLTPALLVTLEGLLPAVERTEPPVDAASDEWNRLLLRARGAVHDRRNELTELLAGHMPKANGRPTLPDTVRVLVPVLVEMSDQSPVEDMSVSCLAEVQVHAQLGSWLHTGGVSGIVGNASDDARAAFRDALLALPKAPTRFLPNHNRLSFTARHDLGETSLAHRSAGLAFWIAAASARTAFGLLPHHRGIPAGLAATGVLTLDRVDAVEGLAAKIDAVFFSPITSLCVPKCQEHEAIDRIRELHRNHPRRPQLTVVGVDRLGDLWLSREQRVFQDIPRTARESLHTLLRRAGTSLLVLSAMLLVLAALCTSIAYEAYLNEKAPTATKWQSDGLAAINRHTRQIWTHPVPHFRRDVDDQHFPVLADLDRDGRNEVILAQRDSEDAPARWLVALDHDGSPLWTKDALIETEGEGRRATDILAWRVAIPADLDGDGSLEIIAEDQSVKGSRARVSVLNGATGESIRAIANDGHIESLQLVDLDGDGARELLLGGPHQRSSRALVAVIDPLQMEGKIPPDVTVSGCGGCQGLRTALLFAPDTWSVKIEKRADLGSLVHTAATGLIEVDVAVGVAERPVICYKAGLDAQGRLRPVSAAMSDAARSIWATLQNTGATLPSVEEEEARLRASILEWHNGNWRRAELISDTQITRPPGDGNR